MKTKGNLSTVAKSLGSFSLKIPFGRFRICQYLRGNNGIAIAAGAAFEESDHQFWA